MSNLQRRVQRLEASEKSASEAMRAALEKFAGNLGIDLTRPGVRQVLEDAFGAGTIDREGMVTWEELTRIFWLQNYRRLTVRWEHRFDNFLGMLHLACALILMRHL